MYTGQKTTLRTRHETSDCSNWERSMSRLYIISYLSYLTYMQSISCKMPDWIDHELESKFPEKYQQPQICRWHHSNRRKQRGTKEPLDKGGRDERKSSLKTQLSKNQDQGIQPNYFMANRQEKMETVADFLSLGSKITVMITPSMSACYVASVMSNSVQPYRP